MIPLNAAKLKSYILVVEKEQAMPGRRHSPHYAIRNCAKLMFQAEGVGVGEAVRRFGVTKLAYGLWRKDAERDEARSGEKSQKTYVRACAGEKARLPLAAAYRH